MHVFPKTLQARNYLHSHHDVCRTSIATLAMIIWDMYVSKIAIICSTDEIDSDNSFIIIKKINKALYIITVYRFS